MQVPYEITFEGMAASDAVRARIEKEIGKLERFHDRITSCHVAIITGTDFGRLEVGQKVRFTEEPGEKGLQASAVHLTGNPRHD